MKKFVVVLIPLIMMIVFVYRTNLVQANDIEKEIVRLMLSGQGANETDITFHDKIRVGNSLLLSVTTDLPSSFTHYSLIIYSNSERYRLLISIGLQKKQM